MMIKPHRRTSSCCFLYAAVLVFFQATALVVVSALDCLQDLQDLHDLEAAVTDTSAQRTYILCPNKIYPVGFLDFNYNLRRRRPEGGPPVPLRPNLRIQCGAEGKRSDNCWITGGHLQVDGTAIRGIRDDTLTNVVLQGLTFQASIEHSVWVTKAGDILFQDCEWAEHTMSRGPVMLDFYNDLRPNDKLEVRFQDSRFHANRYFGQEAQSALVTANSEQNHIFIERTVFQKIDMKWNNTESTPTYLIESLGPTHIHQSCFMENQVVGAAVAVYGNQLVSSDVHLSASGGDLCSFASVFDTLQQYQQQNPRCVYALRQDCPWMNGNDGNGDDDNDTPVRRYAPFAINALDFDDALEVDTDVLGGCSSGRLDEPDAQNNNDPECLALGPCHIGFSTRGELVTYRFAHNPGAETNGVVYVDITVRVSSARPKDFRLEILKDSSVAQYADLRTEGGGFDEYRSITWSNVPLDAGERAHTVVFVFVNGGTNLCSISVDYTTKNGGGSGGSTPSPLATAPPTPFPTVISMTPGPVMTPDTQAPTPTPTTTPPVGGSDGATVPRTWAALDYDMATNEQTPLTSAGGCNQRNDGVDAQWTADETCRVRDQATCNVGWWDPEETLVYNFVVSLDGSGGYDVRIRAAAARGGKNLSLRILQGGSEIDSYSLDNIRADGWQVYSDHMWENVNLPSGSYELHVSSMTGSINVCSVAVLEASDGSGGGGDNGNGNGSDNEFHIQVPGTYSAMFFHEASSLDMTDSRTGNCPYRQFGGVSVDAQINTDAECGQAIQPEGTGGQVACNVAWTDAGEFLTYDFVKNQAQSSISVSLRVASPSRRSIGVEILTQDGSSLESTVVDAPGNSDRSWTTYQTVTVWESVDIGNEDAYRLRVTFLEGRVNLCSVGINEA